MKEKTMKWKEYLEHTVYDNDDMSYIDDAIKIFQKNNPASGWVAKDLFEELHIPEEEPEDENLKLVEFYGILKIEKMARLPIIGKMNFDSSFKIEKFKHSDLYEFCFEIFYSFSHISASHVKSIMDEIIELEDEICNISLEVEKQLFRIHFKVNIEDIIDLESAAKAATKFNL